MSNQSKGAEQESSNKSLAHSENGTKTSQHHLKNTFPAKHNKSSQQPKTTPTNRTLIPAVTFLTPPAEYFSDIKAMCSQFAFVKRKTREENASFSHVGPHKMSVLIELIYLRTPACWHTFRLPGLDLRGLGVPPGPALHVSRLEPLGLVLILAGSAWCAKQKSGLGEPSGAGLWEMESTLIQQGTNRQGGDSMSHRGDKPLDPTTTLFWQIV